ncbi:uncharacterized protein AFUA_5G01560 [Aspergillus fumigatus Af293]|uniref:Uncharacterized protein n=1 Tax=Aspergillus fumigatus (strain ATCC MYA-4609 / CBS 101355 / FGSC A1100 / Af293) TaxID=330879 RepID=Q4WE29_ASPFU|nr:hypothetical protein AFUA_5G01560 [Aspergillus fumigatus Af293]EAL86148.1 hypothetical protein AFUA_5G01560 [Aspergillus fumigatus Af293]
MRFRSRAIDQFREPTQPQHLTYCDHGGPLNGVTAAITCLILVKWRRDRKLVMPVRSKYRISRPCLQPAARGS